MTELQGKLLALEVDFTGAGTTYDTMVCLQNFDSPMEASVEKIDTDCGQVTSVGVPGVTVSATCINDLAPGSNQASFKKCDAALAAGTKVKVRLQNPVVGAVTLGSQVYRVFDAYFSEVTIQKDTNAPMSFTFTLNSTGTIDVTV